MKAMALCVMTLEKACGYYPQISAAHIRSARKPEKFMFTARFPKTIFGKILGERTELSCEVRVDGDGIAVVDFRWMLSSAN